MNRKTLKAITSSNRTDWETPKEFYERWNNLYNFTVDVSASDTNHLCNKYYTIKDDALKQDWSKDRCWCNPPYARGVTKKWVKKAYEESLKGAFVCMLLPSRTDVDYFHRYIVPFHSGLEFIRGRIVFTINGKPVLGKRGEEAPAPFPSLIVTFGECK